MTVRFVLRMTVLTLVGVGLFEPVLRADDGVARVAAGASQPYYVVTQPVHRQPPNPTYWTYMPCPFHGCCDACGDPNCPGRKGIWTFPAVRWVLDPDYYAVSPDYGWSPPSKRPVQRASVVYQKYVPDVWYGQARSGPPQATQRYPIIGTPTDTTQLGYYYQQAPTWQPKDILPAAPHPQSWHVRPCVPGPDGSYVVWLPIRNVYVPLDQIPHEAAPETVPQPAPRLDSPPVPQPVAPPVPAPAEPGTGPTASLP